MPVLLSFAHLCIIYQNMRKYIFTNQFAMLSGLRRSVFIPKNNGNLKIVNVFIYGDEEFFQISDSTLLGRISCAIA